MVAAGDDGRRSRCRTRRRSISPSVCGAARGRRSATSSAS
jgi:hypothetical protein